MPSVLLSFALGEHGIKDTKCLTGNVAPLKNVFSVYVCIHVCRCVCTRMRMCVKGYSEVCTYVAVFCVCMYMCAHTNAQGTEGERE